MQIHTIESGNKKDAQVFFTQIEHPFIIVSLIMFLCLEFFSSAVRTNAILLKLNKLVT